MSNQTLISRVKSFVAGFTQQSTLSSIDPLTFVADPPSIFHNYVVTSKHAYDLGRLYRHNLWVRACVQDCVLPPVYLRELDSRFCDFPESNTLLWIPLYRNSVIVDDWVLNVETDYQYDVDQWDNTYEVIIGACVELSVNLRADNVFPSSLLYLRDLFANADDYDAIRPVFNRMAFFCSPYVKVSPGYVDDAGSDRDMHRIMREYHACLQDGANIRWSNFIRDECIKFRLSNYEKRWMCDYIKAFGFLSEVDFDGADGADGIMLEAIDFVIAVTTASLPHQGGCNCGHCINQGYRAFTANNEDLNVGGCDLITVIHPGNSSLDVASESWSKFLLQGREPSPGVHGLIQQLRGFRGDVVVFHNYMEHGKFFPHLNAEQKSRFLVIALSFLGTFKMVSFFVSQVQLGRITREHVQDHYPPELYLLAFPPA